MPSSEELDALIVERYTPGAGSRAAMVRLVAREKPRSPYHPRGDTMSDQKEPGFNHQVIANIFREHPNKDIGRVWLTKQWNKARKAAGWAERDDQSLQGVMSVIVRRNWLPGLTVVDRGWVWRYTPPQDTEAITVAEASQPIALVDPTQPAQPAQPEGERWLVLKRTKRGTMLQATDGSWWHALPWSD